jgi:Rieske Fe-S protein
MALEYMHQQGILHLNLNAQNIFLRADGQLLVAEAGLVRMLAPQIPGPTSATSQQSFELENGSPLLRDRRGKALYGLSLASAPAPELLLGQSPDTATDVYALGALLYYLLTGHRVMRGSTLADITNQHLNAAVPSLNLWRQDLPMELDRLLSSAMTKNLARRPRYPGELANACAGILAPSEERRKAFGVPSALPVSPAPSSTPALPLHSVPGAVLSRRRVMTLIAASGGVTVAAGVAVWVAGHSGGSAAPVANSGNASTVASTATSASPQVTTGASSPPGHSGKVVAQTADIPLNSAKTFPIANSNNPGVLIHLQNNRFVAFNSTCTHAGCAVAYNRQNHLLECPCHGASFDPVRNAAVVGGPAPSPLAAIAIMVNRDGTITTGA